MLQAFQENASALGESNPYLDAASAINDIRAQRSGLSLDEPAFPNIENPLVPMDMGTTLPSIGPNTLNLPSVSANTVRNTGCTPPLNQLTTQQKLDILFGRS